MHSQVIIRREVITTDRDFDKEQQQITMKITADKFKQKGLLSLIIFAICVFLVQKGLSSLLETDYPLPYSIKPDRLQGDQLGLVGPSGPQFVLLGDRMAKNLYRFRDSFVETVSQGLSKEIKYSLLSGEKDGLHRSLHRLKSLSPPPKVVLLHTTSWQHYEMKFTQAQTRSILKNKMIYENPWIQTIRFFMKRGAGWIFSGVDPIIMNFQKSGPFS